MALTYASLSVRFALAMIRCTAELRVSLCGRWMVSCQREIHKVLQTHPERRADLREESFTHTDRARVHLPSTLRRGWRRSRA